MFLCCFIENLFHTKKHFLFYAVSFLYKDQKTHYSETFTHKYSYFCLKQIYALCYTKMEKFTRFNDFFFGIPILILSSFPLFLSLAVT